MKSVKVADYMTRKLISFTPETSVVEALGILIEKGISGAPVVDAEGKLVGMLSEVDVIKVVIEDSYYNENAGIVSDYMHSRWRRWIRRWTSIPWRSSSAMPTGAAIRW